MAVGIFGLYVITDPDLCPGRGHVQIARSALAGGARIIQIRDKTASDRSFYEAALRIRKLTADADALFLVNDRVDVAAAVGADGVNVGQTDLPVAAVRAVMGPSAIVGVSAASIEHACQAQTDGADYVGFGPVFATGTKPDAAAPTGLDRLAEVCGLVSTPVVAIGGIGLENISAVAAAGASGAAVVSAVVCADDMERAVIDLVRKFEEGARLRDRSKAT